MKEFIDKLISKLDEEHEHFYALIEVGKDDLVLNYNLGKMHSLEDAISIVNELAEEYKDCILVHTQGLDEGIQCAMCTNPMKSDRGCDGGCSVNKEMYKKVFDVINRHAQNAPYTEGE